MSIEANKALIRDYFAKLSAGDPSIPDLLSEDVTWWVPQSSPLAGLHEGRDAVLALMGSGVDLYDANAPMEVEIEEIVAEGGSVCVETVITAKTASGEPYRNHYHFAFRVREGRIVAVKEYFDTLYAQRMLFDPQRGEGQLDGPR
jgi:ketosteroid isomerase-like protein